MFLEEDQMIHLKFPTNDGQEVEIIRRETQITAGVALHWADRDGHPLFSASERYPFPMTTDEASRKGIQL